MNSSSLDMSVSVLVLAAFLSNVVYGFEPVHRSTKKVQHNSEAETNEMQDGGNATLKKFKRWIPSVQDVALDYPDIDDSFGDAPFADIVKPFGSSAGAGNVLLYRPGSQRPHGAVTRTVFNPPSGFIPRIVAAAKAAFATLTGPQTVLSRTTYLRPPRPAIAAVLPQTLQSPAISSDQGSHSTNAAAAAAAAAVAAITRTLYDTAPQRGPGIFIEKGNPFLPPTRTYSQHGMWSEPPRASWNSYQPPDLTFRFPQEPYGYQPNPNYMDSQPYVPASSYLPYGYRNPGAQTDISIEPPRSSWYDTSFNSYQENGYGVRDNNQFWRNEGKPRAFWSDERQNGFRNVWTEKRMSAGRPPGGFGGYAEASADTPPNGDSFADAKVTSNGAAAVAAAVWPKGNLEGIRSRFSEIGKGSRNDNMYGQSSHVEESNKSFGQRVEANEDRLNLAPKILPSQGLINGNNMLLRVSGQKSGDENEWLEDSGHVPQGDLSQLSCSKGEECHFEKNHSDRLRIMFPSRRKHKYS